MLQKCKLCKERKELQDSHVIPKLLYRYMRRYQDATNSLNGLMTLDSKKQIVDITQRQWKDKLFCRECEERLSKNETKFTKILHDINAMERMVLKTVCYTTDFDELSEWLRQAQPSINIDEVNQVINQGYFNEEKAETLKYFSASYVLRQLYLIKNTLGQKEVDMLESYLLGSRDGDFNLRVKLNYGQPFKAFSSSLPIDKLIDFKHYNFIVPEMWFHLIFDINDKLGAKKVIIQPDNFLENKDIMQLLCSPYQKATVTKKAKLALE